MGLLLVLLLLLLACGTAMPQPPVMPSQFEAAFVNPADSAVPQTGTWYYDFARGVHRVDGGNQLSCNRVSAARGQKPTYCTTYLNSASFFVVFPFAEQCCAESSVGLLRRLAAPRQRDTGGRGAGGTPQLRRVAGHGRKQELLAQRESLWLPLSARRRRVQLDHVLFSGRSL